ncbi:hypothetical protein CENSYa_1734 [Cenarchaeum symbiosum A]|uniref:Uncharacterized protein n=1 Tax=Cenarchaeum symbiosum (strain A) TaxID=414004 RepID=A0RYC8_CENSY|nr:hypothetical protein CENSYa_1734 [Cenarchaeum symbiosum A]
MKAAVVLILMCTLVVLPVHGVVTTLEMDQPSYENNEIIRFSGTESEGSMMVNVIVRGTSGSPTLLGDPVSDPDGAFQTSNNFRVSEIFDRIGVYNATGITGNQSEAEGITIQLQYDGDKVVLVPDFDLALNQIGNKEASVGEELSFTVSVTDRSLRDLSYRLEGGVPAGAEIGESTGRFSWTPSDNQGHSSGLSHSLDIVVEKGPLTDRETIMITVLEQEDEPDDEPRRADPAPAPTRNEPSRAPAELGIAQFVDEDKDPQSYIDRYNNEPEYAEWFDESYPEYQSIYEAVGLEEPAPRMDIAPFVDEDKDPQSYIDRYNDEPGYAEWFDESYPEYPSIYEAVGLEEPVFRDPGFGECGIGTELMGGECVIVDQGPVMEDEPEIIPADDSRGGGCLIATAAYGSELAPQVQQLREVRDGTLMSTASGSAFMSAFNTAYYAFSPAVADLERGSPEVREAVRLLITPMLATLSIMSLAEEGSEQQVLGLGIAVISLNLGMYVAAPAAVGIGLGRRLAGSHWRRGLE